ncbi:MAG: tyrosine-type recombinase/integrase [Synergistaceae bacterium]|nr:tyrosine-type recombinase/integrase [Candidatus Equadaptatus faecalis]
MKFVEAIDQSEVAKLGAVIKEKSFRNYVIFYTGIYCTLRISDILNLKVSDIYDNGKIKNRLIIKEQKTKKIKDTIINRKMRCIFADYISTLDNIRPEDFLFQNKEGKALNRMTAYYFIKDACRKLKIENVATHSLRKTGATALYNQTKSILDCKTLLNHSSSAITERYLRIDRQKIDSALEAINF